ncbi:MAG: sigma 54-interacting transcriptional regulator [candidate division Zixibacteria bacterium]|jgi:transcriptional regulator with GAF, ATPase, and Fis domain|nr:sigma 54-interacting transcriptional regulator [candidate division Zixibacteria bacterium]
MEQRVTVTDYDLIERLSETPISEAWLAVHRSTGRKCFLKLSRPDSPLGGQVAAERLYHSYQQQRILRSRLLITAKSRGFFEGREFAEYPWLDDAHRQVLTTATFWRRFPESLTGICAAVDLLHSLGLVHCDLKLSNFLVSSDDNAASVRLIDFDFLMPAYADLERRIVGTYEYMAPEITAGERVSPESDNYSIGVLVRRCLADAPPDHPRVQALATLSEQLTQPDALDRPTWLLGAVERSGAVDAAAVRSAEKCVLASGLIMRLYEVRSRLAAGLMRPSEFLKGQRCLGLPDELLQELDRAFGRSRRRTIVAARRFVGESEVRHLADSWHISAPDKAYERLYGALEAVASHDGQHLELQKSVDLSDALQDARKLRAENKPLRAYLRLSPALDHARGTNVAVSAELRADGLIEAGELCLLLTRSGDALACFREASGVLAAGSDRYYRACRAMVQIAATVGESAGASQLVDRVLGEFGPGERTAWKLEFRRLRAFLDGSLGQPQKADKDLSLLLEEAEKIGDLELVAKVHLTCSAVKSHMGKHEEARLHAILSAVTARRAGSTDVLFSAYTSLCILGLDAARYGKAIRYGERALRLAVTPLTRLFLGTLHLSLTALYARLSEFERGEASLSDLRSLFATEVTSGRLAQYYWSRGCLLLFWGKLREAETHLRHALSILSPAGSFREWNNTLTNLSDLELYRGRHDRCRRMSEQAVALAEQCEDVPARAEAYYRQLVVALVEHKQGSDEDYLATLSLLLRTGCYANGAVLLLFMILYCDRSTVRQALSIAADAFPVMESSGEPVMKATALLRGICEVPEETPTDAIPDLKRAYQILMANGRRFAAMHICRRIADLYAAGAESKVAHKFYLQARHLADAMDNRVFTAAIEPDLTRTSERDTLAAGRLQAFLNISRILRRIDNYERALQEVVRFAATETGAERGVLLLQAAGTGEFRIKTSLNCDLQSLQDITDFSRSIPAFVAQQRSPLLIDDAMRDERTRDYRSIIAHNIRSVLCVPVWSDEELVGALYLDHHTIPAMFDESDFTFVTALSNFLSVILGAVEKVRTVSVKAAQLTEDLVRTGAGPEIITKSPKVRALLEGLQTLARTGSPLLFQGESGTGKELFCDLVHRLSRRADRPFVKLNCSAVTETMYEAELFGVARRSVTEVDGRLGRFEMADGGTLLLDEVGDMSKAMQAKVLRVLETGEYERVGNPRTHYCDVRIICATNRDLEKMVATGEFRLDLLYRINQMTIVLPPLRERTEDIAPLTAYFLEKFSPTPSHRPRIGEGIMNLFMRYQWPGNVRELRNVIERCCLMRPGKDVRLEDLPTALQDFRRPEVVDAPKRSRKVMLDALRSADWDVAVASHRAGIPSKELQGLDEVQERTFIRHRLETHRGNISRAARAAGIPLTTFRRRMKRYHL